MNKLTDKMKIYLFDIHLGHHIYMNSKDRLALSFHDYFGK